MEGRSVIALTGTKCNIVNMPIQGEDIDSEKDILDEESSVIAPTAYIEYETDEEEFTREDITTKSDNSAKTAKKHQKSPIKRKKQQKSKEYHLAYLNLWWSRMLREAKKEEKERSVRVEEQIKKEKWNKWFNPEIKMRDDLQRRLEFDNSSTRHLQTVQQQQQSNNLQVESTQREGDIFRGVIYPGGRLGTKVVVENDCATGEQPLNFMEMNI